MVAHPESEVGFPLVYLAGPFAGMENYMDVATVGGDRVTSSARLRTVSFVVALLLAAGTLLMVQQRADAAPVGAAVTAQIGNIGELIQSIVCPILFEVRDAFAGSAFFGFVEAIINSLLAFFGCTASP